MFFLIIFFNILSFFKMNYCAQQKSELVTFVVNPHLHTSDPLRQKHSISAIVFYSQPTGHPQTVTITFTSFPFKKTGRISATLANGQELPEIPLTEEMINQKRIIFQY